MSDNTASASFQDAVQAISTKLEELKEQKKLIKEIEADVPMELEDLLMQLKDLKKQAKDRRDEFLKDILESSAEYVEHRENVQALKEEIAQAKLALFTEAANLSRKHGDLDQTVMVQGSPVRVQTQREVMVFMDGKEIK
jgi:chromosome segregation ATPase